MVDRREAARRHVDNDTRQPSRDQRSARSDQLCGAGEEVAIALLLRSFQWEALLKEGSSSASVALQFLLSTVDGWSIVRGAPVPDSGWARRLVRWQHSVMPGEPCQGEL